MIDLTLTDLNAYAQFIFFFNIFGNKFLLKLLKRERERIFKIEMYVCIINIIYMKFKSLH